MLPYIACMDPMGLHIIKLTVYESSPDSLVDWLGSTLWGRRDFRFLDIRENPPIVAGLETLVTCFFLVWNMLKPMILLGSAQYQSMILTSDLEPTA
jgi:hypothetical protein